MLWGLPYAGGLYFAIALHGMADLLVRGLFCAICLLPPTLLMGATLPAISRWVKTTPEGVSWLGFFYGGNIAGAVFGCLLAGFYLLRVHDMSVATYVAVAIDVFVAIGESRASARNAVRRRAGGAARAEHREVESRSARYVARSTSSIALSGVTALAAEAVWTRLLSLLLGATTYTFSLILAAFLVGLGIGSTIGSVIARTTKHAGFALAVCQFLLTGCIAWAAYSMTKSLAVLADQSRSVGDTDRTRSRSISCVVCGSCCPRQSAGARAFRSRLAAVGGEEKDPARLVGTVYAANTVGGIVGALLGSLLIIAWLGTQTSQRLLIVTAASQCAGGVACRDAGAGA